MKRAGSVKVYAIVNIGAKMRTLYVGEHRQDPEMTLLLFKYIVAVTAA